MIPQRLKSSLLKRRLRRNTGRVEPLLVLGDGRSGTTLLMQLLGTSSQIAFDRIYPFENRYLTYLLRWALLLGEQWQPGGDWNEAKIFEPPGSTLGPLPFLNTHLWNGQELWPRCFAAVWREFSDAALATSTELPEGPVIYYAEKTPFWMPQYLRQVMTFRTIVLVRDPRDVFLSIMAFNRKRGYSAFGHSDNEDDWTFARRYISNYKKNFSSICEEQKAHSGMLVKYESMAVSLKEEAERLSQWLGVRLNASTVEDARSNYAHHMTSTSPGESVERWRHEMASNLKEYFRDELQDELRHLGYES